MQVENELRVAEANARKLIVQAEAESRANQLRQQSLTPCSSNSSLLRNGTEERRFTEIRR